MAQRGRPRVLAGQGGQQQAQGQAPVQPQVQVVQPVLQPIVLVGDQLIFDEYLRDILDIGDASVRAAIRLQGLTTFQDFIGLESADVTSMVTAMRKPGGTVVRPTVDNPNATVTDPGVNIGLMSARRLEMVRFYVNHCKRIQRLPVEPGTMTLQRLDQVYLHFKN